MYESTEDILNAYVFRKGEPELSEHKTQYTVRVDSSRAELLDQMAGMFSLSKTALATYALEAAISELFAGLPDELQEHVLRKIEIEKEHQEQ